MLVIKQQNSPPVQTAGETHTLFRPECERAVTQPFTPRPPDPTAADLKKLLDRHQVVFLTGRAGTGKTYLLRQFIQMVSNEMVITPTGTASENLGYGSTIHFTLGFPSRLLTANEIARKASENDFTVEKVLSTQYLIIDEVSMVRADVMDSIDKTFRKIKGVNSPFGGVKTVLCGDPFQLPPVAPTQVKQCLLSIYGGIHFFHAPIFKKYCPQCIELQTIHRQTDSEYINILNRVRTGGMSMTERDLKILNSRCVKSQTSAVKLVTTNKLADFHNEIHLNSLEGQEFIFNATFKGEFNNPPVPKTLRLKPGAKVMITRNESNYFYSYRNGNIGVFEGQEDFSSHLTVKIDTSYVKVSQEVWQDVDYTFDYETKKVRETVRAICTQYPLIVAEAMTIHRAQGKTFSSVSLDRGGGCFDYGHLYVGLSRCPSLENLTLVRPIKRTDAQCDIEVRAFMDSF